MSSYVKKITCVCAVVAALCVLPCVASAAVIDFGVPDRLDPAARLIELQPNMADQDVKIFISGGEKAITGMVYVQVGDGGPELDFAGGSVDGPAMTLDFENGMFRGLSEVDQQKVHMADYPQLQAWDLYPPTAVTLQGELVTIRFDTTDVDFAIGQKWELKFLGTLVSDTMFNRPVTWDAIPLDVPQGWITIVPEPGSLLLMLGGLGIGGLVWFRRRRAR